MKSLNTFLLLILILFTALLTACIEDIIREPEPQEFAPPFEEVFDDFQLGRVLFYDKNLSANNDISCASCHKQEFAFADNVALSEGTGGRLTSRNSMPLQNINTDVTFVFDSADMMEDTIPPTPLFWDGREKDLFTMVLLPFTDSNEHALKDVSALVQKVRELPYYQQAFENVFGPHVEIDEDIIAQSLVTFVTNIRTSETRFDAYLATGGGLSEQELEGKALFFEKYDCNACHQVENPSGYLAVSNGFSNIGLELLTDDQGRQEVTGLTSDARKFKIPSLRNVVHTAPYMHDGRFQSLDSVIEHYSTRLFADPNLDTLLQDENGDPLVLNISGEEREAIITFLGTLTDELLLEDPSYSNPFEE